MNDTEDTTKHTPASSRRPDWLAAGSGIFLVLAILLAFYPIVMVFPGTAKDDIEGLLAAAERVPVFGWTAVGLATISGLFSALHKLGLARRSNDDGLRR